MKKRILSMLLVIVLVLSVVPVSALAEEPGAEDGIVAPAATLEVTRPNGKHTANVGVNLRLDAKMSDGSAVGAVEWKSSDDTLVKLTPKANGSCGVRTLAAGNVTISATANGQTQTFSLEIKSTAKATAATTPTATTAPAATTAPEATTAPAATVAPETTQSQQAQSSALTPSTYGSSDIELRAADGSALQVAKDSSLTLAAYYKKQPKSMTWTFTSGQKSGYTGEFRLNGQLNPKKYSGSTCTVTGVKAGKINVNLEVQDGRRSYDRDFELTVTDNGKLTIVSTKTELYFGEKLQLTVNDQDSKDVTTECTFVVSPDGAVTIDKDGMLTANKVGSVTITAKNGSYTSDPLELKVNPLDFTELRLNGDNPSRYTTMSMHEDRELLAYDGNGVVGDVQWTFTTQTDLAVLNDSTLHGNASGTVEITASKEGYNSRSFTVTIEDVSLTGVKVRNLPSEMRAGTSLDLNIKYTPDNASNKDAVVWKSDRPAVAEIKNGKLFAYQVGEANLSATLPNGKTKSLGMVTVTPASMIVHNVPLTVQAGKTLALDASCVDASGNPLPNTSVKWTLLSQEERVSLTGSKLETGSDMQYRHDILLRAEAVGCDASAVDVTVQVIPVTTGITLKIGSEKVNNKTYVVDLSNAANVQHGIMISADIQPASAEQSIRWEVSDPGNICTEKQMTTELLLTPVALKSGTVTVKAYAGDGSGEYATTTIQFSKLGSGKLKNVPTQLRGGASLNLATYLDQDKDLDDKTVTWSIQDNMLDGKKIATLGAKGKLTTKAVTRPHTIKVTVTGSSGGYDTKDITLYPATQSITISGSSNTGVNINGTSKTIKYVDGMTLDLVADVKPTDANVWPLKWSSTNKKVATVDPDSGVVTILDAGKVRIDCTSTDGSKIKGSLNLEITKNAKSIKITAPSKSLTMGQSMNLTATVMSGNGVKAANQNVIWEITDVYGEYTDAAQVSETGRVTGIYVTQSTEVMVTATSVADPDVSGNIILTIVPDVNKTLHAMIDGELVDGAYVMDVGDYGALKGVWLKKNGNQTDAKDCEFISANEKVVTVEDGELTAVGYGSAVITLRCTDPQTGNVFTNTFTVYVMNTVRDVTITVPNNAYYLRSGQHLRLRATAWTYNDVKAENQDFYWEVKEVVDLDTGKLMDTDIATIDSNGVLEAGWVDDAHVIEVKAISLENGIYATVRLLVYPKDEMRLVFEFDGKEYEDIIYADYDELLKSHVNRYGCLTGLTVYAKTAPVDENGFITVNTTPLYNLTWKSSNDNVIEVFGDNYLVLNGTGSTRLTVKGTELVDGKNRKIEASITLNVNQLVGAVAIEQSGVLASGKSIYLSTTVENPSASNKKMLWSLDPASEEFATIERYTGKLSAKRGLTEQKEIWVTATPADGSTPVSKEIIIYPLTTKVRIIDGTMNDISGTTVQAALSLKHLGFTATATPNTACQTAFMWTSSNTSVAVVDPDTGVITILGAGKTVIRATAVDGSNKFAKFTLRVK